MDWQPPADLARFLDSGPAPLYIGFGSMSSSDPTAWVRMTQQAIRQTGGRAIISAGWSGLAHDATDDAHIFMLGKSGVPHSWLFPRVAGVVHHGGAGTTAAGVRAGVPALIIPHMSDQPYWGRRVHELGIGPKPIPRHKLTAEKLAAAMAQLATDATMRRAASELGEKVRGEHGVQSTLAHLAPYR